MKVSELIRKLRVFMYEHGDIDCWYGHEGRWFEIDREPGLIYIDEYGIVYTQDDFKDVDINDVDWLTPVCAVN